MLTGREGAGVTHTLTLLRSCNTLGVSHSKVWKRNPQKTASHQGVSCSLHNGTARVNTFVILFIRVTRVRLHKVQSLKPTVSLPSVLYYVCSSLSSATLAGEVLSDNLLCVMFWFVALFLFTLKVGPLFVPWPPWCWWISFTRHSVRKNLADWEDGAAFDKNLVSKEDQTSLSTLVTHFGLVQPLRWKVQDFFLPCNILTCTHSTSVGHFDHRDCVSLWQSFSVLQILSIYSMTNPTFNRSFILETQDDVVGGFSKWPQNTPGEMRNLRVLLYFCWKWLFISRGSLADIGLPLYPRPSVLGGQNLRFTPVPVITDWNHSGCRYP